MAGSEETLNVIALVSGGKDSFFSILHCLANGHRVLALANLYPHPPPLAAAAADLPTTIREPSQNPHHHHVRHRPSPSATSAEENGGGGGGHPQQEHHQPQQLDACERGEGPREGPEDQDEADLNSFMYQTVGHQVIPLYARATGLPLFRHPIVGTAVYHGLSYDHQSHRRHRPNGKDEEEEQQQQEAGTKKAEEGKEGEGEDGEADETESLVPLLRAVLAAHPEANALCTGAILSTYQRTRVESVALRLGLVPLSYLWQFPELPLDRRVGGAIGGHQHHHHHDANLTESAATNDNNNNNHNHTNAAAATNSNSVGTGQQPRQQDQQQQQRQQRRRRRGNGGSGGSGGARHGDADDDGAHQLLRDMAAVGLDARIVKVASAGLDEGFLWENVASAAGLARVRRAMRRFGAADSRGSALGEGGEFETLVVDGPPSLFRGGRIVVAAAAHSRRDARVVREGGGCVWLNIRRAAVEPRTPGDEAAEPEVRVPGLLDPVFRDVLQELTDVEDGEEEQSGYDVDVTTHQQPPPSILQETATRLIPAPGSAYEQWCFVGGTSAGDDATSRASDETVAAQTARAVRDIWERLRRLGRSASDIASAVVVLKRMADFPAVNTLYGELFTEPNPPARVTVSCGDAGAGGLLPGDCHVAIYLTVQVQGDDGGNGSGDRRGLHVQSRSYWAPANIGPYSQAISVPLFAPFSSSSPDATDKDDTIRAVSIAGQIPLIPASMTLPTAADADADGYGDSLALQVTLALQHLWRVGAATDVRWWTGAAAYFPRNGGGGGGGPRQMRRAALLTAAAWRAAHLWALAPGEGGDADMDDEGPDIWDRRFNSAFRSFGGGDSGGDGEADTGIIPDWRVVRGFDVDVDDDDYDYDGEGRRADGDRSAEKRRALPFLFTAEVDELPRRAGVEWHAHLGLAGLGPGSVQPWSSISNSNSGDGEPNRTVELHHVLVRTAASVFVHSTAAVRLGSADPDQGLDLDSTVADVRWRVVDALASVGAVTGDDGVALQLIYADRDAFGAVRRERSAVARPPTPLPVLPCYTLWCPRGRRLALVAVFHSRFYKSGQ